MKTLNSFNINKLLKCRRRKHARTGSRISAKILCSLFLLIASILFSATKWYLRTYGATGFDSILFTLFSNLKGVDSQIVTDFIHDALVPAVIFTTIYTILFFIPFSNWRCYGIKKKYEITLTLILAIILTIIAGNESNFFNYMHKISHQTHIYEERYVDPHSVKIDFPEEKRNLIYIFLESMETSYLAKREGGALPKNVMPELYTLARENINFSHNSGVGGFLTPSGTTWTVSAMSSQTSAIPLKASPGALNNNEYGRESFLPGAVSINNILSENGYNQALIVGSDSAFANRDVYFKDHEIGNVYDLNTARAEGFIPEDYYVWWGMEDKLMFEYSKNKITEMAKSDQPFSVVMLTVDTHFPEGYVCEQCPDTYHEQYNNVISCSSHQVYEFINWLKKQDFYKNTTVVLSGDHLTMDYDYVWRNIPEEYERHIYNCFINSAVESDTYKKRTFTSFDMFPTTLAAMGCEIEGDRLGLGTNLFSDKKTHAEEMGYDEFDEQLSMSSNYYIKKFMVKDQDTSQ
ncbi:MAG: LTA synthase family protein [Ruminococcaceae bacterium]|nr:LTA synthase family protein [Oscillospiraceae bacterium]